MENNPLSEQLLKLEERLQLLIAEHQELKQNHQKLTEENKSLTEELQSLTTQLDNFQNQYKITKLVSSTTVEKEEATELKLKLNDYIKEIDKCIAHLSQ